MVTINISLPTKLKSQTEALIKGGYYASFNDLIKDSLRHLVEKSQYDLWVNESKKDLKAGRTVVLKSNKKISDYFKEA